jgi:hypothetical protein
MQEVILKKKTLKSKEYILRPAPVENKSSDSEIL